MRFTKGPRPKDFPHPNRMKTHCIAGHPYAGDNLWVDSRGYRQCRECNRFHKRLANKKPGTYFGFTSKVVLNTGRARLKLALEAIREGGKIGSAKHIIDRKRLGAIFHFSPEIRRVVYAYKAASMPKISGRLAIASSTAARHMETVGMLSCVRGLPRDQRDDVIAEMMLHLSDGRLLVKDIETRAREFVRASFRSEHNRWGPLSLDMPASIDNASPLISFIREDQRLWAEI